jgi:hypothetical protein
MIYIYCNIVITVGNIYTWGDNSYGQLGRKESIFNIDNFKACKIKHNEIENNVSQIACGAHFALALTNDGMMEQLLDSLLNTITNNGIFKKRLLKERKRKLRIKISNYYLFKDGVWSLSEPTHFMHKFLYKFGELTDNIRLSLHPEK